MTVRCPVETWHRWHLNYHTQSADQEFSLPVVMVGTCDRCQCHAQRLTYPRELLSLGFIVSDSLDYSAREVRAAVKKLDGDPFASVLVLQRDYGYSQVS